MNIQSDEHTIRMDANKTREYIELIFSCLVILISSLQKKDFYFLKKSCTASLGTIFSSKM